jgi:hypothetical protein
MTTHQPRPRVALHLPEHVPDFIKTVRATMQAMQANAATFPGSAALVAKMNADLDALEVAETATRTGTHGSAAARNDKLHVVKTGMAQIEALVQLALDANPAQAEAIVAQAALHLHKSTTHGKQTLAVHEGPVGGSIRATAPSGGDHAAYNWQVSLDAGKTYSEPTTTTVAHTSFTGLPVGVTVLVRVRVTVKDVTADWSAPVSFVVR